MYKCSARANFQILNALMALMLKNELYPSRFAENNSIGRTNCAPLVADLFLFCNGRDFMMSLSAYKNGKIIEAFNSTSRYLDDVLNIYNTYFNGMVNQIYPSELRLNKANSSDTEGPFLDLHFIILDGFDSSKIYDKRDDFDFDIINIPFSDGDDPHAASYGVYISQLIRFARVYCHVADFNNRNKILTAKLLKQGYRYQKLRHYDFVSKFNTRLKSLLKMLKKFRKKCWSERFF